MKTRKIIIWILLLILIDQLVKLIIYNVLSDVHFELIPNLIEFKPTYNAKHSWVNSLLNKNFGINVGLYFHRLLYLFLGIALPMYFSFLREKIALDNKLIDIATIYMTSAIVCALLGNIVWTKGTLDYIYLKPWFVFDLKDVFVDIGVVFFLVYAFKNRKELDKSIKETKLKTIYFMTVNRFKIPKKQ